ncbi:Uu.00g055470.m01.CDS01 [Anthostomella pinea]|uniref:Uu.00g055470.m01.CDS01 n=1 Tax=Anthostomella pinea TaxID=933095 RepID=A0AAI8VWS3_9PEZI|nr:Uu.00g055470.m01.CDS01 [Anthostomella pinea]
MRFLCLHGRGTSAKIFEMQTARIRQALGRDHDFVFVNGTVPADPDVGAATVTDEYFGYVGDSVSQYRELYDDLMDVVKAQGPFDGLMGFSEGGAVAAWMLLENARHPHTFGALKCAIFFSAAVPFDPEVIRDGIVRAVDPATDGVLIKIPTAHIWSKAGDVNSKHAQSLSRLCEEGLREVFVHELGHNVPGSKSDEGLAGSLRAIEHTIENAKDHE